MRPWCPRRTHLPLCLHVHLGKGRLQEPQQSPRSSTAATHMAVAAQRRFMSTVSSSSGATVTSSLDLSSSSFSSETTATAPSAAAAPSSNPFAMERRKAKQKANRERKVEERERKRRPTSATELIRAASVGKASTNGVAGDEGKKVLDGKKVKYQGPPRMGSVAGLLHHACFNGWVEVARSLLANTTPSSKINESNEEPHTPTKSPSEDPGSNDEERNQRCQGDGEEEKGEEDEHDDIHVEAKRGRGGQAPLLWAAAGGHLHVIKLLIEEFGAQIDSTDRIGRTALHVAAERGHLDCMEYFIKRKPELKFLQTIPGKLPIHYAAVSRVLEALKLLLQSSSDTTTSSSSRGVGDDVGSSGEGNPPSSSSSSSSEDEGRKDERLEAAGTSQVSAPPMMSQKQHANAVTKDGWMPIHISAQNGDLEAMQYLIEAGADPEGRNHADWTPLHFAADVGAVDVVEYLLLDQKVNAFPQNSSGKWAPVHMAAAQGRVNILQYFLDLDPKKTVSAKTDDNYTVLHYCCFRDFPEMVHLLVDAGADVNALSVAGWSPLHTAVSHCASASVYALLEKGADPSIINIGQWTPLHIASIKGDVPTCSYLLQFGASLCSVTKDVWSPLHIALDENHWGIVQLLLEYGADTEVRTVMGMTPMHLAVRRGNLDTATLLLQSGAQTEHCNHRGWTPMHRAAARGMTGMVQLLIHFGANIHARNPKALTPLDYAVYDGQQDTVDFLLRNGAKKTRFYHRFLKKKQQQEAEALQQEVLGNYTPGGGDRGGSGGGATVLVAGGLGGKVVLGNKTAGLSPYEVERMTTSALLNRFSEGLKNHDVSIDVFQGVRPRVFFEPRWEIADWLHITLGRTEGLLYNAQSKLQTFVDATNLASAVWRHNRVTDGRVNTPESFQRSLDHLHKTLLTSVRFSDLRERIEALDGRLVLRLSLTETRKESKRSSSSSNSSDGDGGRQGGKRQVAYTYSGEVAWKCFWTGEEEIWADSFHSVKGSYTDVGPQQGHSNDDAAQQHQSNHQISMSSNNINIKNSKNTPVTLPYGQGKKAGDCVHLVDLLRLLRRSAKSLVQRKEFEARHFESLEAMSHEKYHHRQNLDCKDAPVEPHEEEEGDEMDEGDQLQGGVPSTE